MSATISYILHKLFNIHLCVSAVHLCIRNISGRTQWGTPIIFGAGCFGPEGAAPRGKAPWPHRRLRSEGATPGAEGPPKGPRVPKGPL